MRISFVLFLIIYSLSATSQTIDQWRQLVNWDGVSHWSKYMKRFPAYQGPNALPVPRLGNGSIDSNFTVSATGAFHFSKGDNTQAIAVYANYCLVKDLFAIDFYWVPQEYYQTSHAIKEKRHIYPQFYYRKKDEGEFYLNSNFQLMKRWRKYIHLAARIGYRFPSGSGFGAARDIDAPGYYFDISFGKPFKNTALKWTGMLGFYSWQIETGRNHQDDAFLFGTGLEWNRNGWRILSNVAGYIGYLEDSGDKPVVLRLNIDKKIKRVGLILGFQQGLHDFNYSSVELGMKYYAWK